jgi:16S rRNA (adenine1518-N6/adenine1519-N6)-dimethyltransferase
VSLLADARYLFDVPPSRFVPPPKVMSGVVLFTPRALPAERAFIRGQGFADFVHALFAQPRKTVVNSMADGLSIDRAAASALLEQAGVDAIVRPNRLTPEQVVRMYQMHCSKGG